MSVLVQKRGESTWEVTNTIEIFDNVWEYVLIGRIVEEKGYYYVELPQWQDIGFAWHRQPKRYQIPRGAMRALVDRQRKAS